MTTAREAIVNRTGGPEVIQWQDVILPPPRIGDVRVRHTAIGLNYIDTYHRGGIYPVSLPAHLGLEAAGVIEEVGEGVSEWQVGDRVATFGPIRGAYSTVRNVAASSLLGVPTDISDEVAAAVLLKGCTAEFLIERCAQVQAGWPVLVHAAAGGVGTVLVQWLKAIGATVIGTVSTREKADLARRLGADELILYPSEDTAQRVRQLTNAAGVRVVFDGVGMDTWAASLDSTCRRGLIVSYGNASAPVTGIDLGILAAKGSLFNTRPILFDYYSTPSERESGAERLWEMVRLGKIEVLIGQTYKLEDAALAHRDLEAGKTVGSTILIP